MDDVLLAQTLRGGGVHALENVIDRYLRELFDYAVALTGDPDRAAVAVENALLAAEGSAAGLDNPRRFRPWLYALVRNEGLRVRASGPAPPEGADDTIAGHPSGPPAHAAPDSGHSPRTVRAGAPHSGRTASEALGEVFDLAHRQLMNDAEIADVLGISERHARRLRSKGDSALSDDGAALSPLRAAHRAAAPPGLSERIRAAAALPGLAARRAEIAKPVRRSGFPVPLDRIAVRRYQRTGRSALLVAAGLAVLALIVFAVSASPVSRIRLSGGSRSPSPTAPPAAEPSRTASPAGTPQPSSPAPQPPPAPTPAKPGPAPDPKQPGELGRGAITGPVGKCLDVFGGRSADGTPVGLFHCDGGAAQLWTVGSDGAIGALGKCLDFALPRGNRPQGAVLFACDGTPSQKWTAAGGLLVSRANNRCLEVPPGDVADLTAARIGICAGEPHQRWRLPVEP